MARFCYPSRVPDSHALRLADTLVLLPSGMLVRAGQIERRFPGELGFGVELVLATCGGRALAITTPLRQILAVDLHSGEVVWRASAGNVHGLAIVHAAGRPLLGCSAIAKWGGGARRLFDLANGAELSERELGPAFTSASPAGHYYGDANHPEHYGVATAKQLVIHRARDGAPIRRIALAAPEGSTTTTTSSGVRVTEFAIEFDRGTTLWFGPHEFVIASGNQIHVDRYAESQPWQLALPIDHRVRWVASEAESRIVLAGPPQRVDAVRIEPGTCEVIWPDCEGIAIVEGELVTGSQRVGSLASKTATRSLVGSAARPSVRALGPLPLDPILLHQLAKLRALGKDRHDDVGLELAAIEQIEVELGTTLPIWALGLLALRSGALERRWKVGLDQLIGLRDELARVDALRLAAQPNDPRLPTGLVALGMRVTTKKIRSRGRRVRATTTVILCALGDDCVLVERLTNLELDGHDEPRPGAVETAGTWLSSPRAPLSFLAPLIETLAAAAKTRVHVDGSLQLCLR